jgi:sugar transferase (PEP-CTERM/EpsH1 system associated)
VDVLFLSQRVPHPPDRGDRITTHHVLRHFRELGARVRVGCLAEDDRDIAAAIELRSLVAEVVSPRIRPRLRRFACTRGLLTGTPLTLPYFRHRALEAAVAEWRRRTPPDLVFVYSSSMAQYVLEHDDCPRIMQFAELDSDKWRQFADQKRGLGRWVYSREARLLLEFERRVARSFDASLVVSEVERDLFVQCIPDVRPTVVPNGVDVDCFQSRGDAAREPGTVVFTGIMDYAPNVDAVTWFAREAWPAVRRQVPHAKLLVVGNRPCQEIRALDGEHGITVTGWVPATPPYFDRSVVAIAPLRLARGIQNKVLEAMSMALPVVVTSKAAQGIRGAGSDTLVVADDAPAIAAAVIRLLTTPAEARAIGARAAAFVRAHFRWEHTFRILDEVIDELFLRRRARSG